MHVNAPPSDDAGHCDNGELNTSCSTIAYYEINSDGSVSDDEGSVTSNTDHNASVEAMSQTDDTIPPEASARLLTSPSHLFDAAIAGSMHRIAGAFSSLRLALTAADEVTLFTEEPVVLSTGLPLGISSECHVADESLSADSELFVPIRLHLMEFQYAFAEAMEYLDEGWAAADVVKGVFIEKPMDDEYEACMRLTNVCMYMSLCRNIHMYSPFCTLASEITEAEAIDAVSDYLYTFSCPCIDGVEVKSNVRAKFSNTQVLPFLEFIALQAGDCDACAPFWSGEVHSFLQNSQ